LDQIFSSKANRTTLFDCVYDIDNLTMQGVLKILTITKTHAEGVFISGNGKLWETLSNKNLRDYDFSAYNHTLSVSNVTASETNGDYIYDLCDRGAFITEATLVDDGRKEFATLASCDITERYPAVNIKTIFETVLNEEGYGVEWTEVLQDSDLRAVYLLYMEDNKIRNDAEWEKSAVFEAEGTNSHNASNPTSSYLWVQTIWFPTENYDNGNNFNGAANDNIGSNVYTIPETGTYRFIADLDLKFTISGATIITDTIDVGIYNLTTTSWVWKRSYDSGDLDGNNDLSVYCDTYPTEFTASDQLEVRVRWNADLSDTSWTLTIAQNTGCIFYNSVSRYYGAGSTVDLSVLMPDMKALDFFSMVCNYMNFYTFYREETHVLEIEHGRQDKGTVWDVTPEKVSEGVVAKANYTLEFNTDKAQPPDDVYVDNSGQYEDSISFKVSRTLINDCLRLLNDTRALIPVLWSEGDPLNWFNVIDPPEWETKGNYRLLRFTGTESYNYTLTYGGDDSDTDEARTQIPVFEELNIDEFHRYELTVMEQSTIEFVAQVDMNKLYNQSYFKSPIWVDGYGKYWIDTAEQVKGNIYKIKAVK